MERESTHTHTHTGPGSRASILHLGKKKKKKKKHGHNKEFMTKWLNNYTRCNAQQKKSQRASEKVQAASVQVECLTFQAPRVKYRPCTSENPQGPLRFIYLAHCLGCVTAASPPLLSPSPVELKKQSQKKHEKLDDTYPLFPLSLLQPHCYLHIHLNPATRYSCPD